MVTCHYKLPWKIKHLPKTKQLKKWSLAIASDLTACRATNKQTKHYTACNAPSPMHAAQMPFNLTPVHLSFQKLRRSLTRSCHVMQCVRVSVRKHWADIIKLDILNRFVKIMTFPTCFCGDIIKVTFSYEHKDSWSIGAAAQNDNYLF